MLKSRKFAAVLSFFLLTAAYIYFAGAVSKKLSDNDKTAIRDLSIDAQCTDAETFDGQVRCIRNLQQALLEKVPDKTCTKIGNKIEPLNFLERGYGCCFERARFIEKALRYYHIKTRHVSLYDNSSYGMFSILIPGIPSHATVEALTEKGWMGVDSRKPIVLMTKEKTPLTYEAIRTTPFDTLADPIPSNALYVKPHYIVVYGLYSRHGFFFGANLPAPEINYRDFIKYNFTFFEKSPKNQG